MNQSGSPVLDAIIHTALDATQAASGWLVVRRGDRLVVASRAGTATAELGSEVDATSSSGFCIATGDPAARQPRPNDPTAHGAAGVSGVPASLLTVPCCDDTLGTVGALELADRSGGPFTLDDVELVSLLAGIAGAAIASGEDGAEDAGAVPDPGQLAAELTRLQQLDRRRYSLVARSVAALLGVA